jgi:hypothetical protein
VTGRRFRVGTFQFDTLALGALLYIADDGFESVSVTALERESSDEGHARRFTTDD